MRIIGSFLGNSFPGNPFPDLSSSMFILGVTKRTNICESSLSHRNDGGYVISYPTCSLRYVLQLLVSTCDVGERDEEDGAGGGAGDAGWISDCCDMGVGTVACFRFNTTAVPVPTMRTAAPIKMMSRIRLRFIWLPYAWSITW